MNPTNTEDRALGPTVRALGQLSPSSQGAVVALVRSLAEREGISVAPTGAPGIQSPIEGVPLWVAKLRAERCSERTVRMYEYLARRYLERDPAPTRLEIQSYLADRLERVSPAATSNERKALASLFGFLHQEGLWPSNPLNGVGHVRVRYSERPCPEVEDVAKVLGTECLRRKDTDKLHTLVLLLATTGLRVSEAAGILKENVDLGALEVRVMGKGDRQRVVPLLPQTAEALARHMRRGRGGSPYLFPGRTRTGHMEIHNFEKTLRRACLGAGVRPFTPHQLRHFYATHMLRSGAKLEVVARILGHAGFLLSTKLLVTQACSTFQLDGAARRETGLAGAQTPIRPKTIQIRFAEKSPGAAGNGGPRRNSTSNRHTDRGQEFITGKLRA